MPHRSLPHLSFPPTADNMLINAMENGTKRTFAFETTVSSNDIYNLSISNDWFDFDNVTASTIDSSICGYSSSSSSVSPLPLKPKLQCDVARKTSHSPKKHPWTATAETMNRQQKVETVTPISVPKELRDHCGKGSYWMEPTTTRRRSKSIYSKSALSLIPEDEGETSATCTNRLSAKTKLHRPRTITDSSRSSNGSVNESKIKHLRIPKSRSRWAWIETKKSKQTKRRKPATEQPKKILAPASVVDSSITQHTLNLETTASISVPKELRDYCGKGSYWTEPRERRKQVKTAFYNDNVEEKRKKVKKRRRDDSTISERTTKVTKFSLTTTIESRDYKRPKNSAGKQPFAKKPNTTTPVSALGQHFSFRAVQGPNRPIDQYALDLISQVCSCKNPTITLEDSGNKDSSYAYQQVHRILDKPLLGCSIESEKNRLLRLQLRQRYASATSIGMSPIEFSKKLLALWGGQLEPVDESIQKINRPAAENTGNNEQAHFL